MRLFTRSILMLLLCTLGVLTTQAKTEKVHATFENPSNTNTTWNAETKTFTWSTTYYNQLKNIGLPSGDITKYKKLVVDCSIKSGDQFRILFYKGGSNLTLYAKDGVNEFVLADTLKVISPNDYNEYLLACDEICLSGNNAAAPGEAVINDVYLETYDDEGEKVYATFENPSNTNTTWNAETKTFTWSTTYYNQLKNIGLPSGDISVYKKLVVDCNIKSGDQFRILIYKGGSNLTLYAKDGVNEFILADTLKVISPNDYNEYLLACDEICLSGNNAAAPGEAVINAVYLETYPENESVEIPDIVYEEDPGKPEGEFVDFTEVFSSLQPKIGLGTDGHPIVLGNGDVVVGQRTKDVIADLSAYSKLTLVTSPNLKLVLYMNHEVDAQQNAGDYAEGDAGKYVFMDVQADENGIIEVDLTKYDKQDLNCICLPWDNSNKGTVWYILLTKKAVVEDSELMKQAKELAADAEAVAVGKLLAAIAAAEESGDESNLQAAIDQLKADNADVEKDETARVKTDGWKKFTGNDAAALAPDWAAPAVTTYDGRTAQPAEVYEGTVATTGQIIYQDITGLTNGKYKVGFYGTAYFTNGRGFDSTMEDGSTDVAYVFANDEKSFITSRIGTSFSEYSLLQFDVEVTDGNIKLGMAKDKPGTNWHTMQIYQLTWFTTAKAAYAADQEELKTVVAEAKALLADANKTEGRELFEALVNTADEAANEKANMYNVAEIEALIGNLKTSISDFKKANYFINFTEGQYTCYVIDAESGKMMAAGHDYGTRGIVNEMGLDMTIGINTEKRMVTFETQIKNSETNHFLGSNLYMDSPAAEWGLEFQGFGFYITNGTQYINIDANDNLVMSDTPREWIIVTAEGVLEQRLSEMKEATAEKPVDATFLIQGANFNRNDQRNNAWVVSEDCTNKNLSGGNQVNNCAESFHSTFTISQVLKNAPKGIYQMTAQGFYRQDEGLEEAVPVFFIGDKTAGIPAKTGEEDSMDKASASFTEGLYTIDPIKFNFNGEELTVGVKNETATSQWIIFDNFRLSYLGEAASEDQLAALTAEIAIAKSLGVDVSAYEEGVFTAAEATAAVEALKVAEYTQVNKDYTVNAAVLVPDFAQWTGDMVSNKGQHWDGTGTSLYYEQTGAQWGQSSWTNNKKTTVTLPKGKYVLYAAGRASAGTACTAYLKVGDVTRTYTSKGDVGFGVATDGSASFDPTASYANGGKGRGFEYRYVAFEVTAEEGEEIALEVGGEATAEHQWMSFTAPVLLTTDDNIAIMIPVFKGVIETAKANLDAVKGTVGDGLFMKPQAAYNDYAAAVADAEALLGGELTADAIKAAIEAIEVKAQAFEAAPTTAPDANKTYSFELRLGGETPLYMALAEGGITIAEEATLLKFIAVEGAEGQYNLSNADGTLFVGLAGGNAWTMSTLPDQKAAWTFTALPDGAYRINNLVTAGRFVGTNAADKEAGKPCYADKQTSNGNVDWIITEVIPEVAHTWNFTKWSEATIANLKAEAAKVTVEDDPDKAGNTMCTDNDALWSDHEKKPGTTCDTYAASKDNCFWYIGGEAEPKANGEAIAEFAGLEFNTTYGASRALAIAVNYPTTSLGEYNGPAYLWFGGKNQTILTIKNVKAGSQIKMGVESHKPAEARGVQLLIGETVLTDPEGAEVAAPTVYTEQTWAVPAGEGVVDVVVKNTNGCHIYFIDAEIGEDQTVGINSIAASKQFNGTIYNLRGQKMEKLQKGLNIINGRKVVVK